ncbi:carbon-nitrogen hydrolase family protein [Brevibacillus massiliensis]|uniref:carbon-nitrogen hydrolase family protein n=2 Tax=Brevibacillus massiliensis TaxID=1118054 RepID=UPI0021C371D8|nr:carbon-nitrogen hydrolase family protein [Brevibacillus massiliensis]
MIKMRNVTISVCQFQMERVANFEDFKQQVLHLMNQVPKDADYVLFPELFTMGLLTTYPDAEQMTLTEISRLDQFTPQFISFFSDLAKNRERVIIAGSHLVKKHDKNLNVSYIFDKSGNYVEHSKTHLFPAEFSFGISEGDELQVHEIGPAKIAVAICYEAEIPEVSRILSLKGAEIIFCPSYTFTEHGFWRVRHCAQARCIENQVYFVHCPTVGNPGNPVPTGFGKASILSPCDAQWAPNGVVAEAEWNQNMVITGTVDLDALYENRKSGAATTFFDRERREELYAKYEPYATMGQR